MKPRTTILLISASLLLVAVVAAGLAYGLRSNGGADGTPIDPAEVVYPSPDVERAYRLAAEHQDLFAQVACYCGCVNLPKDAHRNLLDCFMNDDGSFEPHALGCSICVDIAEDAAAWADQGKSSDEVVGLVDQKYQSVGPPTVQ